ncbi:Flp family type IVb pilin [Zobellella sp. DQSA1]|uniref:Flp family type IVb pilin n=1 Tax=Zobellella sp. DQSA1 TaxID=3342386 RepID=UPI0035C097A9
MLILKELNRLIEDEDGLTTVEYAVAGALVAATVVLAFTELGQEVEEAISGLCDTLADANNAGDTCS